MSKTAKIFIYVTPLLVIAGGLFVIFFQEPKRERGGEASLGFLDYKKLATLAQRQPNGENYLNFVRKNEAMLHDADTLNDADAFITMGFNIHVLGDDVMAIEAYKQGLRLAPDNSYGLNNIATSYMEIGEFEKAEEIYRKLTTILSGDSSVVIKHLQVYDMLNPNGEKGFLEIVEEGIAVSAGDNLANLLSYLGTYYRDKGNIAKSIEYFEKLVELFPEEGIYKAELGELKRRR